MSTIPLADAKNRLSEVIQSAQDTHERITITKNGRPAAVLMSVEDLQALERTLEWLDDPTTLADVAEAETAQDYITVAQARADLAQRRG
jgi:antitoxin YefM